MTIKTLCLSLLVVLLTSGCTSSGSTSPDPSSPAFTACEEPRPQICTMEYRPVCGTLKNGDSKTYGSGCSACGDADVTQHSPGECGQ